MSLSPTSALGAAATRPTLGGASADYSMFLKLLTTQMQNQDPLKPMDSTEYTAQLAQFSQVEQTIQQTSKLNEILAQLTTQNMAQASGFIGQVGQFDTAVAGLTAETGANWTYSAARPVTSLTATITDGSGKTVATMALDPATSGTLSWNGASAGGSTAPDGPYSLSIAGVDASGASVPVSVTTSGTISEVVAANGNLTLGVNGAQIPIGLLTKLHAAG